MRCTSCELDNPAGMKFCGGCGRPLASRCPSCGAEARADARFCGQCGVSLAGATSPAPRAAASRAAAPPAPADAERRQLTVLFCDLVGSTTLSGRLDAEDLREVVLAYQEMAAAKVERYEGHIAQYQGDGLLVYFGYPIAHEDDPRRAVHAAFGIVRAIDKLNQRLQARYGVRLAVRLGIHTGEVVVGQVGGGPGRENLALGQTPNVAARLEGLAEAGGIVLSAATYRLVRGFCTARPLGECRLEDVTEPIEVFAVEGLRHMRGKAAPEDRALSPLVGRRREAETLFGWLAEAAGGEPRVAVVSGEAGIGKSRLIAALQARALAEGFDWLVGRCSPYARDSAFTPLCELFRDFFDIDPHEPPERHGARLPEIARRTELEPQAMPFLAEFLAVPYTDTGYFMPDMMPQKRKARIIDVVLRMLARLAAERPLAMVVEDLHWSDPSTLELLDQLIDRMPPGTRCLIVLTCRPSFDRYQDRDDLPALALKHLDAGQVEELVSALTGGKSLPPEVVQHLLEKTDGVPLFVEELTRTILESDLLRETEDRFELTGPLPPLAIPATLQGSLAARLDRLSTARTLIQLGAALGRSFSFEIMRAVSGHGEDELARQLERLVDIGLLFQDGVAPDAVYTFKHALIQDAAYDSLLRSTRQQYHQRIAAALAEHLPEVAADHPELLAQHYAGAGLVDQAVDHWLQAAQRSVEQSANLEAIEMLGRSLELLATAPEGPARDARELAAQVLLGTASIAAKGYSVPEVETAFLRARELCRQVAGEPDRLFGTLWGLWAYYMVRSDYQAALESLDEIDRIPEVRNDSELLASTHYGAGLTRYSMGEMHAARKALEEGLAVHEPTGRPAAFFLVEVGVGLRSTSGLALWQLGYPQRALEVCRSSVERARRCGHPYSLALALYLQSWLLMLRREPAAMRESVEENLRLAETCGFAMFECLEHIHLGWTLVAAADDTERGLELMRQGVAGFRQLGGRMNLGSKSGCLVEGYLWCGRLDEADSLRREALEVTESQGDREWTAELHRLSGELALARGGPGAAETAEADFRRALTVASELDARSQELRAATSLARLSRQTGRPADAGDLLAAVYAAFDEGFETPDLVDARELLETLDAPT